MAIELNLNSLKNHLQELYTQLKQVNEDRYKEVISLRLIGKPAQFGSIPLSIAGALTSAFSDALHTTSKYLQFGQRNIKNSNKIISNTIDLRLEAIGKGSTIFYLSGKTTPDLYGNSLIQDSLDNLFKFVSSENGEDLTNNLNKVGLSSIKHYSRFFRELNEDGLELEMDWITPNNETNKWYGDKDRILSLYNTLNKIQVAEPQEFAFVGKLITNSLKGKFEIDTLDKRTIAGTFPLDLLDKMKTIHIGEECTGVISKQIFLNSSTNKERIEYTLVEINISGQTDLNL